MIKGMIEADKVIKTTYIDKPKKYNEEQKRRFKQQWASLERYNKKCQMY